MRPWAGTASARKHSPLSGRAHVASLRSGCARARRVVATACPTTTERQEIMYTTRRSRKRSGSPHRALRTILSCLAGVIGLAVAGPTAIPAVAASVGVQPGFVRVGTAPSLPRVVARVGHVAPSAHLSLDVTLTPRDAAHLAALAAGVSDPASADYRSYLARGAFAQEFGASTATIRAVEASLQSEGLDPTGVAADRLAVHVSGSASAVERAFSITLTRYRLADGTLAFANGTAPRFPASIASHVQSVIGLDSLTVDHPVGLARLEPSSAARANTATSSDRSAASSSGPVPTSSCSGLASNAGYTADQIATAYGFGGLYQQGDLGSGVSIGLVEFTPISTTDISTYAACYGLPYPAVTAVAVDGGPTTSVPANEVEAELDLEDVVGLAQQAKIVVYEGADPGGSVSGNSAYDTYATAVNQDAVEVLSTSWGSCEPSVGIAAAEAEMILFEQAALQGQTVVAASGDDGAEDCYGTLPGAEAKQLAVDDPASQPYVTGVGGTTLQIGVQTTESTWNTTLSNSSPGSGGGGVSAFWAMPSYQSATPASLGVVSPLAACAATAKQASGHPPISGGAIAGSDCRQIPDVSANAGAPYAIYCTLGIPTDCDADGWTGLGGTSASAPTWAALFALADANAACATTGPIGFANPALYSIASRDYAGAFHDVTVGNNDLLGNAPGHYAAKRGFDLASGLGTPDAANAANDGLVTELCGGVARAATSRQLPAPSIVTVRPSTIRARAGVHVTIVGKNLIGTKAVRFGNVPALSFKVSSRTSIVAVAPDGAGLVHVTVTTRAGTSERLHADVFDYLVRPRLYRVAPPVGPPRGRTVVLVGAGMGGAVEVMFGSHRAVSFTVRSATRVVAVAPPGHGSVIVTVRTRGGSSAPLKSDVFRYRATS